MLSLLFSPNLPSLVLQLYTRRCLTFERSCDLLYKNFVEFILITKSKWERNIVCSKITIQTMLLTRFSPIHYYKNLFAQSLKCIFFFFWQIQLKLLLIVFLHKLYSKYTNYHYWMDENSAKALPFPFAASTSRNEVKCLVISCSAC